LDRNEGAERLRALAREADVFSQGCIDIDASKIGTEVTVQWGSYGSRIKNVRAAVERFPYLTEGRNSDLDVAASK
jgi:vanillate/3-O-methylgallate O-demethylase